MSLIERVTFGRLPRRFPRVAVLRLEGVIAPAGPPMRGGQVNLAGMEGAIEQAFKMRKLSAVALEINSPGGSPAQSALLARRIRQLADEKEVPVIAFVEDVAASGGYWLALAADEIYADRNSILGSIGVISAGFGFTGLLEKAGVERRMHVEGERKSLLDPFAPERAEDVERLKRLQKELHASFIDTVRARREGRLDAARADEIFSGDVWTGLPALELGLIDGIGDRRGILRDRFGPKVRFRKVGAAKSWLRRSLGLGSAGMGGAAGLGNGAGLGGEAGDAARAILAALEARSHWGRFGL